MKYFFYSVIIILLLKQRIWILPASLIITALISIHTHTHIFTLTHTKAQFNGCTPAHFPSSCSVCSFTPPHGFTKKMMVKEGWRLPLQLTLTLIHCHFGARGLGGSELTLWRQRGSTVIQNCVALISLSLSLLPCSACSLCYPLSS